MLNGKIIEADDTQVWYKDGERHRLDGPAAIWADGTQFWYKDGRRHRIDGPAVILTDGTQRWYKDGRRHRTDGPAVILTDGTQRWYINDTSLTEQEILEIKESMEFDKMMRTALGA